MTVTVKGKTFPVKWMWLLEATGELMLEYPEKRNMTDILADWENADVMERKSETEGDITYQGFTRIQRIVRSIVNGTEMVQITFVKGA